MPATSSSNATNPDAIRTLPDMPAGPNVRRRRYNPERPSQAMVPVQLRFAMAVIMQLWSKASVADETPPIADATGAPALAAAPPEPAPPRRRWLWRRPRLVVPVAICCSPCSCGWRSPRRLSRALEPLPMPTLLLVSADGVPIARRGAVKERPVAAAGLPRYVTGAFVAIEDRRFYSHWGIDPRGIAARRLDQSARRRRGAGRQHDHPAARQDGVPLGRPEFRAQGAGAADRLLARGVADEGRDPLALSFQHLFRRRRLWPARRRAPLFRRRARAAVDGAGGDAGRAWSRRRRASRRPRRSRRRRRARGWCWRRWSRTTSSRPARARVRPARVRRGRRATCRRAAISPTGSRRRRAMPPRRIMARRASPTTLDAAMQRQAERVVARWLDRNGARLHATPGGAGRDAAGRAGRGDGRRARLRRKPVQPRHAGAAPAGIGVQDCSSTSRRCGRATRPTARSRTGR